MPIGTHVRNFPNSAVTPDWSGFAAAVGVDSSADFQYNPDGTARVVPKTLSISVPLIATSVDTIAWVADDAYQVTGIRFAISTAGGAGANVQARKCTGTQAPSAGVVLTTAVADLNATAANTSTTQTLSVTLADLKFAAGDRLSMDMSGTLTALVGLITVHLKRISNT